MGGTDLNLSFSGSSSATSGAKQDKQYILGDFIVGAGSRKSEGLPSWALVAMAGALLVAVSLFIVRR